MTAAAGYAYFEVGGSEARSPDADVGVHAWGPSLAAAFAQAALGLLALAVAPDDVCAVERREVRAQGTSPETRLVNWVNECLYVHEIEGFVASAVEVDVCDTHMVHGVLHGEELDRSRHRVRRSVKTATLRGAEVSEHDGRCDVRVVVEV